MLVPGNNVVSQKNFLQEIWMLTPPDTWPCPIWDLHMLRPFSPELVMFPVFEFRTSFGTSIFQFANILAFQKTCLSKVRVIFLCHIFEHSGLGRLPYGQSKDSGWLVEKGG